MRSSFPVLLGVVVGLVVASCPDGEDDDPVNDACIRIRQLCGDEYYEGDLDTCYQALLKYDDCRLNCATDQSACSETQACLNGDAAEEMIAYYCDEDDSETRGTCFWQYDTGAQSGFGCQNDVEGPDACHRLVHEETNDGEWLVEKDFMAECLEEGCTGKCGPEWWSLY